MLTLGGLDSSWSSCMNSSRLSRQLAGMPKEVPGVMGRLPAQAPDHIRDVPMLPRIHLTHQPSFSRAAMTRMPPTVGSSGAHAEWLGDAAA